MTKTQKMLQDSKEDAEQIQSLPGKFGERVSGLLTYVKQMGKDLKAKFDEQDAGLTSQMREEEKGVLESVEGAQGRARTRIEVTLRVKFNVVIVRVRDNILAKFKGVIGIIVILTLLAVFM